MSKLIGAEQPYEPIPSNSNANVVKQHIKYSNLNKLSPVISSDATS